MIKETIRPETGPSAKTKTALAIIGLIVAGVVAFGVIQAL